MGELKNHADDPRVIATTIIVNHGTNPAYDTIVAVTLDALGFDVSDNITDVASDRISQVWNLVRTAQVVVTWPEPKASEGARVGINCMCGGCLF